MLLVILLGFVVLGPFARTTWAHGNEIWEEYSYLGGMEGIALGCLTALLVARAQFSRRALWILGAGGTAIVTLSLVFSWQAYRGWLGRTGLNMTLLGVGTCLFIAATAQARWEAPRFFRPLLRIGQYSYEVYLTHMFVVFAFFDLFLGMGKPMRIVPVLFIGTLLTGGTLGALVSHLYSEPMNRLLRNRSYRREKSATAMGAPVAPSAS